MNNNIIPNTGVDWSVTEDSEITIIDSMVFNRVLSDKERESVVRYLYVSNMNVKEWAIFRIKEMPFF